MVYAKRCLFLLIAAISALLFTESANHDVVQAAPAADSFDEHLLQIAKVYKEYGRVDDTMRVAPQKCDAPRDPKAGIARFSESKDEKTHGKKLYSVFAAHKFAYLGAKDLQEQPVGQMLVKQSWVAEEFKEGEDKEQKVVVTPLKHRPDDAKERVSPDRIDHFLPYAEKGGKLYHAAKQAELFIMFKLDPKTKDTDNGWVFGTVTPDGKKVTSSGKVESCMKCHQDAPHDRVFGLPEKK
jgi:hypothetical protein